MIYLLAILWFASGFFGWVYFWTHDALGSDGMDFKLLGLEFLLGLAFGAIAPAGWGVFLIALVSVQKIPQITLFKARNK